MLIRSIKLTPVNINESGIITVIDTVGDIDCSNNLHDQLTKDNPTLFIAFGDLCYKNDLTNFTNTYSDFKNANKLACIIGNHESEEDGNSKILNKHINIVEIIGIVKLQMIRPY